jgi:hypothetical protein
MAAAASMAMANGERHLRHGARRRQRLKIISASIIIIMASWRGVKKWRKKIGETKTA